MVHTDISYIGNCSRIYGILVYGPNFMVRLFLEEKAPPEDLPKTSQASKASLISRRGLWTTESLPIQAYETEEQAPLTPA